MLAAVAVRGVEKIYTLEAGHNQVDPKTGANTCVKPTRPTVEHVHSTPVTDDPLLARSQLDSVSGAQSDSAQRV